MADYKDRMAARLKRERTKRGEQPADVAYKIGVEKRSYERWEEASASPRLSNLKRLADAWDLEIVDLRPEEVDAEALERIEAKLDLLLAAGGLPIDFESVVEGLEKTIAEVGQPGGSTEQRNGEQRPASENR